MYAEKQVGFFSPELGTFAVPKCRILFRTANRRQNAHKRGGRCSGKAFPTPQTRQHDAPEVLHRYPCCRPEGEPTNSVVHFCPARSRAIGRRLNTLIIMLSLFSTIFVRIVLLQRHQSWRSLSGSGFHLRCAFSVLAFGRRLISHVFFSPLKSSQLHCSVAHTCDVVPRFASFRDEAPKSTLLACH